MSNGVSQGVGGLRGSRIRAGTESEATAPRSVTFVIRHGTTEGTVRTMTVLRRSAALSAVDTPFFLKRSLGRISVMTSAQAARQITVVPIVQERGMRCNLVITTAKAV